LIVSGLDLSFYDFSHISIPSLSKSIDFSN
jgi:hypothetical protein